MKKLKKIYLSLPRQHQLIISGLMLLLLIALLLPTEKATASKQIDENSAEIGKRYSLAIPLDSDHVADVVATPIDSLPVATQAASQNKEKQIEQAAQVEAEEVSDPLNWQQAKVKNGDSLAKIFKRLGFSAQTTHKVSRAKGEGAKLLTKLQIGDTLKLGSIDGELTQIEYPLSKIKTLFVNKTESGYQTHIETKQVEIREAFAHGTIKNNFWNAGIVAGLDDNQIISLANLFEWDIDFGQDIRKGDTFHVIYENKYVDGEYIGTGNILAAEFVNQDEEFKAIRFTDGDYYNEKGDSIQKAFLRAPLSFKYISSNFKPRRFHPIQKRWKSHNGTDYAAKKGTPVRAAGNGRVTHSTYNKFNGNYVFIQHGDGIVTKYLHFSKRAVKKGQRVKQGQVIGYVGSTGMSQAPHLHYEFLVNGTHRNPRTVKLPEAKPISKKYRDAFASIAEQRIRELTGSKQALLASQ